MWRIYAIAAGILLFLALPVLVNHWIVKRRRRNMTMTHDQQIDRHLEGLYLEDSARRKK